MIRAIDKAITKLNPLRSNAIFFPSSFISIGKVTTPTMVRVVIKAAIMLTDAPRSSREAANGNEVIAGICKTEPIIAVPMMP